MIFGKSTIYPQKTVPKDFLAFYSSRFDTVEVNNTFYRIPNAQVITNWKNQTPNGFQFSLKFPKVITQIKMLKDCQRETTLFLERSKLLEQKLGPLLLQFPRNFGIEHFSDLADFLAELPKLNRYVVEVRDVGFLNEEFYSLLAANGVALAWVDSPNMPTIGQVTSDFIYVRWEGDRKKINGTLCKIEADQKDGLIRWTEKLKLNLNKNIEIFGYFGKYYSMYPLQT
jgi:uncharacterized protein YecE (DUF72 family)